MDVKFCSEKIKDALEEAKPLLQAHYDEIGYFKDIPLDPDYEAYLRMEEQGLTRSFSARDGNELIGYAVFIVRKHNHCKSMIVAATDILFVRYDRRGIGAHFIKFCEQSLKDEGVMVITQHVSPKKNFSPMLERLGYNLMDSTYVKRIS